MLRPFDAPIPALNWTRASRKQPRSKGGATVHDATPMIDVQGVTKRFGPFVAVNGVSFSVRAGEVVGVLGPNGAGKSTTMRMIAGYLRPDAGKAVILGRDMATDRRAAANDLGYLPEGAPVYPEMTPRGFLTFAGRTRSFGGAALRRAVSAAAARTQLESVIDQRIDTLSKGFKRRLGLAQAILHDPPVLILDEPTDGLDPNQKRAVRRLIGAMSKGRAILISTHILEEVEAVCDRAIVIDRGRVAADASPRDLLQRSKRRNAVTLDVAASDLEAARTALAALPGVRDRLETMGDGRVTFHLTPHDRAPILDAVSAAMKTAAVTPLGLYADQGRLDDVFQALTQGEAPESAEEAA